MKKDTCFLIVCIPALVAALPTTGRAQALSTAEANVINAEKKVQAAKDALEKADDAFNDAAEEAFGAEGFAQDLIAQYQTAITDAKKAEAFASAKAAKAYQKLLAAAVLPGAVPVEEYETFEALLEVVIAKENDVETAENTFYDKVESFLHDIQKQLDPDQATVVDKLNLARADLARAERELSDALDAAEAEAKKAEEEAKKAKAKQKKSILEKLFPGGTVPNLFSSGEFQFNIFGLGGTGHGEHDVTETRMHEETVTHVETELVDVPGVGLVEQDVVREETVTRTEQHTRNDAPIQGGFGGAGAEAKYFVTRNIGLGLAGEWIEGEGSLGVAEATATARFPRGTNAPYVFGGAGAQFGDRTRAVGSLGAGIEHRFSPHFGAFIDGSWMFSDHENAAVFRAGFSLVR